MIQLKRSYQRIMNEHQLIILGELIIILLLSYIGSDIHKYAKVVGGER